MAHETRDIPEEELAYHIGLRLLGDIRVGPAPSEQEEGQGGWGTGSPGELDGCSHDETNTHAHPDEGERCICILLNQRGNLLDIPLARSVFGGKAAIVPDGYDLH